MGAVDVFVRQIDPAGIGHAAVHHSDLPVVAVVIVGGDKGADGSKQAALDALFTQLPQEAAVQLGELAGTVAQHPDLYALPGFALQDICHGAPHLPLFDDEILQEDEGAGLLQVGQQDGQKIVAQGEVADGGAVIGVEAHGVPQVPGNACVCGKAPGQGAVGLRDGEDRPGRLGKLTHPGLQRPVAHIGVDVHIEQRAGHRRQQDEHQPGDLRAGIAVGAQQVEHHKGGQQGKGAVVMHQVVFKFQRHHQQQAHLEQQQQGDQARAAEDQTQQAAFAPAQQAAAFFRGRFFLWDHGGSFLPGILRQG